MICGCELSWLKFGGMCIGGMFGFGKIPCDVFVVVVEWIYVLVAVGCCLVSQNFECW